MKKDPTKGMKPAGNQGESDHEGLVACEKAAHGHDQHSVDRMMAHHQGRLRKPGPQVTMYGHKKSHK